MAGRFHRFWQVTAWLVLGLIAAGVVIWGLSLPPDPSRFYSARSVPEQPGALVRAEGFTRKVPDGARGWRILYSTSRGGGRPVLASALVLAPKAKSDAPRRVIAWAHGTTGIVAGCAPSMMPDPFQHTPALREAIAQGWVIVATDYIGLGAEGVHPYLIGEGEARSVLDAVRAARHIEGLSLADETVVWGHSQGGHAALWTGLLAPRLAPDVRILGVAALAPATDLPALLRQAQHSTAGRLVSSYIVSAYSATYPDVSFDGVVREEAARLVHDVARRCMSGPRALVTAAEVSMFETPIFQFDDPAQGGAFGDRLRQNTLQGPLPVPVWIAQGGQDKLVLPHIQDVYVQRQCEAGQVLSYGQYADRDHLSLVAADSPAAKDLVAWTVQRFNAAPAANDCRR